MAGRSRTDVHPAQITTCALIEESDGLMRIDQRQFGAFKKDQRALAQWVAQNSTHSSRAVDTSVPSWR